MADASRVPTAIIGAVSAVFLNNLPAAAMLSAGPLHHGRALLIGLNVGPNFAVTGSLSAFLWLQTARASGVRIPAACEFGLCGTCKVKKVAGDVEMSHNGGILDHEIDDGFILACCSKPLSALEIEA